MTLILMVHFFCISFGQSTTRLLVGVCRGCDRVLHSYAVQPRCRKKSDRWEAEGSKWWVEQVALVWVHQQQV